MKKEDKRGLYGPLGNAITTEGNRQKGNLRFVSNASKRIGGNLGSSYKQARYIPGNVSARQRESEEKGRIQSINRIQKRNDVDFGLVSKPSGSNQRKDRNPNLYSLAYLR